MNFVPPGEIHLVLPASPHQSTGTPCRLLLKQFTNAKIGLYLGQSQMHSAKGCCGGAQSQDRNGVTPIPCKAGFLLQVFVDPPAKPKLWSSQDLVPDVTYSHDLLHRGKKDANVIYPLAIQDASLCPTT